jgi:hypothetical protein
MRDAMEITVFKEATDFIESVGRKLLQISQVEVLKIVNTNCNCLVIFWPYLFKKKIHHHYVNINVR